MSTPTAIAPSASRAFPFWWYIAVCALAGMWYTTQHLSSHLLQAVYSISQSEASSTASLLLGMPVLCYPLVGWLVDTRPGLLEKLWVAVPALTATTYFFLLLVSFFYLLIVLQCGWVGSQSIAI
ncbi:hypothetical protein Rhopal_000277-T1 [Rhodotorula paludigena]|uniref:MFS transporter n=1 Tax=Rhodotorula paludigena TaxID=86838 RepID=A0AAV5GB66_9BASI|nr:hypothetical protein Rhopal_000277-T1 [Rhodotorula paludigena]